MESGPKTNLVRRESNVVESTLVRRNFTCLETKLVLPTFLADSQIRILYYQQSDFAVTDHVLFDTPLDVGLQCPLLAQRYHPSTHNRKTGKQLLITSFFTPISTPITAHTNCIPKQ
jgi:hypothetical protein